MTPPSPYCERVVHHVTLQSTVPCVTITTLWLAARGSVGWPPPHCREGFRHGSASGPRTCFPSHRPTPGRVPYLEHSTYALLGARHPLMCSRVGGSRYYSAGRRCKPRQSTGGGATTRPSGSSLSTLHNNNLRGSRSVPLLLIDNTQKGSGILRALLSCPCLM